MHLSCDMKRYLSTVAALLAAYVMNRFVLIPLTGWWVLRWYGADALAGGMMLCVLNGALTAVQRKPLLGVLPVSAFLLCCGLFWEYVTPLYLSRSVSDPWDVAAVWLGGIVMLLWLRKKEL